MDPRIDRQTNQEIIDVVKAHSDGKTIQYAVNPRVGSATVGDLTWNNVVEPPCWDFYRYSYRAKPEPREWWVNVYQEGDYCIHNTHAEADKAATSTRTECIKVREVLE